MFGNKSANSMADIKPGRRRGPLKRPHSKTLYRVRQKKKLFSVRQIRIAVISLIFILLVAIFYTLFWTDLFRVKEPVIVGTKRIAPSKISQVLEPLLAGLRWKIVPANALLAISPNKIRANLKDVSPVVADVEVQRALPDILKIKIKEREPLAIWSAAGKFFFVDKRGIAYEEILRSESRDVSLPVIVDERHRATIDGDRVITVESLEFVKKTYANITRQADIGINFFIAPSRLAPDLILVTSEGWKIYFATAQDPKIQAAILQEVLGTQVKDRSTLQYIDLRIPGRVFVK